MILQIFRVLFIAMTFDWSVSAYSADLKGEWALQVEDQKHQPIAVLSIKFTNRKADSCLSDNWLRVEVLSATTKDDGFFPISDRLSYKIENNKLTIGRNEICDAYLGLGGSISSEEIHGDYYSLGMAGTRALGFFSLRKKH
ncbi:hypothetical protein [Solimicrobium silvestre]|uniref:Uncharacterized protein n=1 Tax=Solimicrobium silvestre TaxID=2099400 RepID=A0A2S9GS76_9BURK|nr:hypothetical protein [Solimicrobium silvestre]PRC90569.1 hypothetical protein S2091_4721 [Solimicrobium silvestre]